MIKYRLSIFFISDKQNYTIEYSIQKTYRSTKYG
ncbi:hypothetical protein PEPS_05400 [Persicobacter psychrovividus]|uniref:Uncharacterized protein n=1 Tax=Persicobacter psychrovividus TaxID=387638 RepID=A0ABM7VBH3_9BACT|nr:hypothetical protein PEPS_05400 [Persicobacter psychrovividus]